MKLASTIDIGFTDEAIDPCSSHFTGDNVHSTESQLITALLDPSCIAPTTTTTDRCRSTIDCIAHRLLNITLATPFDHQSLPTHRASGIFVLVETVRRLLASTLRHCCKCDSARALREMIDVCSPNETPNGRYVGYDLLVRAVSKTIGESAPIAAEMSAMRRNKLCSGALGVFVTFALPGMLAICSAQHVTLVVQMQAVAALLIAGWVYKQQQEVTIAAGALVMCAVIVLVELVLISWLNRDHVQQATDRDGNDG